MFFCVAVSCLLCFLAIPIQAHPSDKVVAVYGSTPTLDGVISVDEWDDADIVTFNVTDGANCTVYAKQDGVNLHVAFNIPDTTYSINDVCGIAFDVDHDGSVTLQADDSLFTITRNGTIQERNVTIEAWYLTTVSGWSANASWTASVWQAEYKITYSKLNVTAGTTKTLGVFFFSSDADAPFSWPLNAYSLGPSTWGDMTSNGYNWEVPEFPNIFYVWAILFFTLPAFYYWIKRRQLA